jgi:hypothetical protein
MSRSVSFRTARGEDPQARLLAIRRAIEPRDADLLYAGQRQRARILERTARGIDVDGRPFAPYSTRGPYYYRPSRGAAVAAALGHDIRGEEWTERQKAAAKRFLRRITTKSERGAPGAPRLSRTGRTIRFESYAAFKRWLGRSTVDLRGASAPHMLQAIQVVVRGARELVLGIYGEAAARATGHNEGTRTLPRRRFFGASAADVRQMVREIYEHVKHRLEAR